MMNIEATKPELIHLWSQTQKKSLLTKVKKVFDEEHTDWWDDIDLEEKQEVETGFSQADKGMLTPHKKVIKHFDK